MRELTLTRMIECARRVSTTLYDQEEFPKTQMQRRIPEFDNFPCASTLWPCHVDADPMTF